ncbi:regulator [Streptomyces sp. ICBB 8177]|nr:regulator [Streptomyces sp. ICBB 8177]
MLERLPTEDRDRLLGYARETRVSDGTWLFEEGGPADRFWVVRSGTVALETHVPGRGGEIVETLGDGELVGWSWLFEPYRWHLGARARGSVETYEFDARRVRDAVDADPRFGLSVVRCVASTVLGRRLRATRTRLLDLYAPPSSPGKASGLGSGPGTP